MVENLFVCILWNAEVRFQTEMRYISRKKNKIYIRNSKFLIGRGSSSEHILYLEMSFMYSPITCNHIESW